LTSTVPQLRGIGLYDDVPTWPHAHQHSRPPLLLAGEAVEWASFKNDFDKVTVLLGCTELVQRWRWSVLSWLGNEQRWNSESHALRFGISRRIQEVLRNLQPVGRDERLLNRFFFSGRVVSFAFSQPLPFLRHAHPLILRVASSSATFTRASPEQYSHSLRSSTLLPTVVPSDGGKSSRARLVERKLIQAIQQSYYVLQTARAVHTKVVPRETSSRELVDLYWKILDKLVPRYGEVVGNACLEVSGKIAPNWSSLTRNQQNCSIAIFKTLSNLLYDVKSSRSIRPDLLYLWIV
jgi:hypothetical protein